MQWLSISQFHMHRYQLGQPLSSSCLFDYKDPGNVEPEVYFCSEKKEQPFHLSGYGPIALFKTYITSRGIVARHSRHKSSPLLTHYLHCKSSPSLAHYLHHKPSHLLAHYLHYKSSPLLTQFLNLCWRTPYYIPHSRLHQGLRCPPKPRLGHWYWH